MEESQTLVQFYELKLDLFQAYQDITQLAADNFGKKTLLKKDYQSLIDLMRESVTTTRLTVSYLRLIFNMEQSAEYELPSTTQTEEKTHSAGELQCCDTRRVRFFV